MDYEKAYKDALERARKFYNDCVKGDNPIQAQRYVDIFHELKESEDERIREELIGHCKDLVRMNQDDKVMLSVYEPWLAYLERQKEQKSAKDTALQKAFINSKIDYTLEEKCDASDYAEIILPTSITYGENEEEYKLHKIIEAAFITGQKKEQNPAEWSEEDELFLGVCKNALGKYERSDKWDASIISAWLENRLKSLPPQPKQEWSEEDEKMLTGIMERGSSQIPSHEPALREEQMEWLMNRLKFLRPRSHWKPSEEQICALDCVAGAFSPNNKEYKMVMHHINTLRNMLKQL